MTRKLYFMVIVVLFFCTPTVAAQNPSDTLVFFFVTQGKKQLEDKKYKEALESFKRVFALKSAVPDEVAYYYGYALLHLSNFSQSKAALKKYIELQGRNGLLYDKTLEALEEADCKETGFKDAFILCDICFGDSTITIGCRTCKEKGYEVCPLCKGNGVVLSASSFGNTYRTCHRCAGEKIIKCTTCKSSLKETLMCYSCSGKGRKKIRKKCIN